MYSFKLLNSGMKLTKKNSPKVITSEPEFNNWWLYLFTKRNRLNWRVIDYAHKNAIDQDYVHMSAEAFCKYGEDLVFGRDQNLFN